MREVCAPRRRAPTCRWRVGVVSVGGWAAAQSAQQATRGADARVLVMSDGRPIRPGRLACGVSGASARDAEASRRVGGVAKRVRVGEIDMRGGERARRALRCCRSECSVLSLSAVVDSRATGRPRVRRLRRRTLFCVKNTWHDGGDRRHTHPEENRRLGASARDQWSGCCFC